MRPISSLSFLTLGILSSWHVLLFWGSVYILIFGFQEKRRMHPVLRNTLLLLLCSVNYSLFQLIVGYTSRNPVTETVIRIVAQFSELPVLGLAAAEIFLTITEAVLIRSTHQWYNTHITSASVKETIETLPVGICVFEADGKITLRNNTMDQLCRSFMGIPLLNGNEFVQRLTEKRSDASMFTVALPGNEVWSFTKDEIRNGKSCFTLLAAYNVTEAEQKTKMLAGRQKMVKELNRKLLAYNEQIEQIAAQQEILNAKVRIHDELGSGLLAIKHYLVSGGSDEERAELLERLKGNISFLQQEEIHDAEDEYALVLSTAENLGVSVRISGTLPQSEPGKHIMASAIHECFTNIIRHTNGDTLYVSIGDDDSAVTAWFTDNNTRIIDEISETGGLRSLRDLIEQAGGEMRITKEPRFCIAITLPKRGENYGISCSYSGGSDAAKAVF